MSDEASGESWLDEDGKHVGLEGWTDGIRSLHDLSHQLSERLGLEHEVVLKLMVLVRAEGLSAGMRNLVDAYNAMAESQNSWTERMGPLVEEMERHLGDDEPWKESLDD